MKHSSNFKMFKFKTATDTLHGFCILPSMWKVHYRTDINKVPMLNVIGKNTTGQDNDHCGGIVNLLAVMRLLTDKLI